MGKYCGNVGYRTTSETSPGIWSETIIEHKYYGDVLKNYVRNTNGEYTSTIKTPDCNNSLSIVADPYAFENFHNMLYAVFMGTKWTISNVDVQYPRLILTLGGVYNDEQINSSSEAG